MKPFAALLIVPPHGGDFQKTPGSLRFVPVRVESVAKATGRAVCVQRNAGTEERKEVAFTYLATTPAVAIEKAALFLSPLLARAPLTAMGVTTAGAAENAPQTPVSASA